jgi:predicted phage terminase large subunit-like protein
MDDARTGLLPFTLTTFPKYQAGWFHREVCSRLDKFLVDVREKRSPRLMLFAPPRHGKSEIVSKRFPAYALGQNPDLSFIATSYGDDLASRVNRDVQRIIDDPLYGKIFPETSLPGANVRSNAKGTFLRNSDIFEIVGHRGSYRSAGVGGGITGMGCDTLVIDDPIKDAEQAMSKTYRDKVWEWFASTAYTRLMPGGGVLIILTRWHEDDLAGRLIHHMNREGGERWEIVSYPAIAEKVETHRNIGEALHPERYGLEDLERIKKTVGSRVWASLYQQRPAPADGTLIKRSWLSRRWRRADEPAIDGTETLLLPPKLDELVIVVDAAFKDTEKSDRVAVGLMGRHKANKFLLDIKWGRMGFPDTLRAITDMRASAKKKFGRAVGATIIEDKANGSAAIEVLKKHFSGVIAVSPGKDSKESRIHAICPELEAGNFWLPLTADWVGDFVEEAVAFPKAAHDDAIDMTAYGIARLSISSEALAFERLSQL